jgi:hypothetical protein
MPHILFFATAGDLVPVLEQVESRIPLKYVRFGHSASGDPVVYDSVRKLPNLGIASNESSIASDTYLVSPDGVEMFPRSLSPLDGKTRFVFDQLNNPKTISLTPGGWWKGDVLLYGRIATASKDPASLSLMKLCASAFRRCYSKKKAYWLGSEAMAALESGKRLTIATQSPPEFDLSLG